MVAEMKIFLLSYCKSMGANCCHLPLKPELILSGPKPNVTVSPNQIILLIKFDCDQLFAEIFMFEIVNAWTHAGLMGILSAHLVSLQLG